MISFALIAALLAAEETPAGLAAAPQTSQDIVVEGVRPQERRQQVRQFIKALSDVPNLGQIGKFHAPVCPTVMGLSEAQNRWAAQRMKKVAEAAGIRTGDSDCSPNVFVIASVDKGSTIDALYRSYPAYFGDMRGRQVRELVASKAPSVAWQVKGLLSADGTVLKKTPLNGYSINEGTSSGSRVRAGTMPQFVSSIVMIEREALTGLNVTQVADFAAMRAFADTDPSRAAQVAAPTILTILDKGDDQMVPLSLTHWDLGYLKSLYATSNAYFASYQQGEMEQIVEREVAKAE